MERDQLAVVTDQKPWKGPLEQTRAALPHGEYESGKRCGDQKEDETVHPEGVP